MVLVQQGSASAVLMRKTTPDTPNGLSTDEEKLAIGECLALSLSRCLLFLSCALMSKHACLVVYISVHCT